MLSSQRTSIFLLMTALGLGPLRSMAQNALPEKGDLKYSFSSNRPPGFTPVKPDDTYTPDRGFGFDLGSKVTANDQYATGQNGKPFFFSAKVPGGSYQVTVMLGDY